jgi:hypothetical protein
VADVTDAQVLARAQEARRLMEDKTLVMAFAGVRHALLEKFEQCPIRDIEGQHEIKLMLKLLGDVRANLQSMLDSGKVVESRISMSERAKRVINAARS